MELPCSALYLVAFMTMAVPVHHHQPRLLVVASAPTSNLTPGVSMTPPGYIASPSGVFAFGFRALDASNPGKFLLATWFHSNDDAGGNGQASSSSQLQSVVWFAKQSSSAALATARSVLSVTADGQLVLADTTDGVNQVLWRVIPTNLARGSLLVILDCVDRLRCVCPDGYTYADPQHTDTGCTPEFVPQSCDGENNTNEYTLLDLPNTTWKTSIYYKKFSSITEDQCRDYCLNDCYCTAALMVDGTDCVEVAGLTNGRQASDVTTKALIKVRQSGNNHPAPARASSARAKTIVAVTVCVAFVLLAVAGGGFLAKHYLAKDRSESSEGLLSVRAFSWKELHQATNGFEKLLGKGSFGEVYQGKLRSPQRRLIAVKRLINSNEYSEREFTNEVQSIGQIHHRNLVRMIGYCKEGKHRMLVLEFMPGGSLRGFLFKPERPPWSWRAEAALGIARGIEYLHDGCASPIIHCDIKPDNILLDDTNAPKITDFGISKLLGDQQVHTTVTNIRGTRGYIAPEWFRSEARIDTKADVYSFGVVLLEMICCRKCQDPLVDHDGSETVTLFGWAGQLVSNQMTELILHKDDEDAVADLERVERFARVAFWCIDPNPSLRPTMHHVVQILETLAVEPEVLPDPPACYVDSASLVVSSV